MNGAIKIGIYLELNHRKALLNARRISVRIIMLCLKISLRYFIKIVTYEGITDNRVIIICVKYFHKTIELHNLPLMKNDFLTYRKWFMITKTKLWITKNDVRVAV